MSTPQLLPCPFCGHDTPEFERLGTPRQSCIVICGNCGARHESSDEGDRCGQSWNERAPLAAQGQTQPVAWRCELAQEDGSTKTMLVEQDPDGLRFNDMGEPSPFRVTPLYAAPQAVPAVPLEWSKAVQEAYGWLWNINNEPMAPIPMLDEGKAAYQARKALRDLLTTEQRGEAINAVRATLENLLAARPQAEPTTNPKE